MRLGGHGFRHWVTSSDPDALCHDLRQASLGNVGRLCGDGMRRAGKAADGLASLLAFARDVATRGAAALPDYGISPETGAARSQTNAA